MDLRWGINPGIGVVRRGENIHRDTQRKGQASVEAETGVNAAPPKDCQAFLGSTGSCKRSMEQILLELCQHLDFRLSASRTVREYI